MIIKNKYPLVAVVVALSGCAAYQETWLNRGHGNVVIKDDHIHCYSDANLIDGERLGSTICATRTSGFLGDGEPRIEFGPYGRRLMWTLATDSLKGKDAEWHGINFHLQCTKISSESTGKDIGRNCKVTASAQHLMSANFIFSPEE